MNKFFLDTALLSERFRDVRMTKAGQYLNREKSRGFGKASPALLLPDGRFLAARTLPDIRASRSRVTRRLQEYLDAAIQQAPATIASRRSGMRQAYRLLHLKIDKISQRHDSITGGEMQKVVLQIQDFLHSFADPRHAAILMDDIVWDRHGEILRIAEKSLWARGWRKLIGGFDLGRRYYGRKAAQSLAQALVAKYHVAGKGNETNLLKESFQKFSLNFNRIAEGRTTLSLEQVLRIHHELDQIDFSFFDRRRAIRRAIAHYSPGNAGFKRIVGNQDLSRDGIKYLYVPYLKQRLVREIFRDSSSRSTIRPKPPSRSKSSSKSSSSSSLLQKILTPSLDTLARNVLDDVSRVSPSKVERMNKAARRYQNSVIRMSDAFACQSMNSFFSTMPEIATAARDVLDADPMGVHTPSNSESWSLLSSLLESCIDRLSQGTLRNVSHHLSSLSGQSVMFTLGLLSSGKNHSSEKNHSSLDAGDETSDGLPMGGGHEASGGLPMLGVVHHSEHETSGGLPMGAGHETIEGLPMLGVVHHSGHETNGPKTNGPGHEINGGLPMGAGHEINGGLPMLDVVHHFITTLLKCTQSRLGQRETLIRRKLTEMEKCYNAGLRSEEVFRDGKQDIELAEHAARLFGRRVGDMVAQGLKGAGWGNQLIQTVELEGVSR